jgi:hypothetical protein
MAQCDALVRIAEVPIPYTTATTERSLRMGGARLTVHVTIEPGESLSGSVVADPADQAIAFSGWLGLVEAINLLRRRAGQVTALPPSSGATDADGSI